MIELILCIAVAAVIIVSISFVMKKYKFNVIPENFKKPAVKKDIDFYNFVGDIAKQYNKLDDKIVG